MSIRKTPRSWLSCFSVVAINVLAANCSTSVQRDMSGSEWGILDAKQETALTRWLGLHANFHLATTEDCDCDEDIKRARRMGPWGKPVPHYEPYVMVGDFNRDGQQDFAAVLIDRTNRSASALVIFNGPISESSLPVFVGKAGAISHRALFQTQHENYLLIGPFESEGCIFEPTSFGYIEDCGDH